MLNRKATCTFYTSSWTFLRKESLWYLPLHRPAGFFTHSPFCHQIWRNEYQYIHCSCHAQSKRGFCSCSICSVLQGPHTLLDWTRWPAGATCTCNQPVIRLGIPCGYLREPEAAPLAPESWRLGIPSCLLTPVSPAHLYFTASKNLGEKRDFYLLLYQDPKRKGLVALYFERLSLFLLFLWCTVVTDNKSVFCTRTEIQRVLWLLN